MRGGDRFHAPPTQPPAAPAPAVLLLLRTNEHQRDRRITCACVCVCVCVLWVSFSIGIGIGRVLTFTCCQLSGSQSVRRSSIQINSASLRNSNSRFRICVEFALFFFFCFWVFFFFWGGGRREGLLLLLLLVVVLCLLLTETAPVVGPFPLLVPLHTHAHPTTTRTAQLDAWTPSPWRPRT